jgi:two-component system, NarL family, invasion response regulator UvrY
VRILVVDDHPIVRAGLRRLFADARDIDLIEAASGREALALARARRPDLAILDLNLPDMGGFDIIARLARAEPRPRLLVLSMHDDPIFAARALEAGADGYVGKSAPPTEIIEAVSRLGKGQRYLDPALAQRLALWRARGQGHPLQELSRRDLDILRLLAEGRSLSQIADALGIGYKTVANNCVRIKAKLGVERTAELIRIAVENQA